MPDDIRKLFDFRGVEGRQLEVDQLISSELESFLGSDPRAPFFAASKIRETLENVAIPEDPVPARDYFRFLFSLVNSGSVRTHAPKFIGHMTSALPTFIDSLSRVITAINQNVVKVETSRDFSLYERNALGMVHKLVYAETDDFYKSHALSNESTLGMVVSGGTLANIAALWCARNHVLSAPGPSVEAVGLGEALRARAKTNAVVIGSEMMHYSFRKAVDLIGLGEQNLVKVKANHRNQIDIDALRERLDLARREQACVIAVVGVAGTTETGNIDPLERIAALCREFSVPFHVDAACGGPALFSSKHSGLLKGIEQADSVTIDAHKQLYTPMGVGMVVFKDPARAAAIEKSANYIVRKGSEDLGRRTLEGSRPAMSAFLHGALHMIGRSGFESLIDAGIAKTRWMADWLSGSPDFELLAEPELNILVYRHLPKAVRPAVGKPFTREQNELVNQHNIRLQDMQKSDGTAFVSRTLLMTTIHGAEVPIVALRCVLANPLTSQDDILATLEEQNALAERM